MEKCPVEREPIQRIIYDTAFHQLLHVVHKVHVIGQHAVEGHGTIAEAIGAALHPQNKKYLVLLYYTVVKVSRILPDLAIRGPEILL